jgi:hypothetical protein
MLFGEQKCGFVKAVPSRREEEKIPRNSSWLL